MNVLPAWSVLVRSIRVTGPLLSFRYGRLHRGFFGGFRDNDPCDEVNNNTNTKRNEGYDHPDQPDDTRVDIDMLAKSPADPAEHPFFSGAVQPVHVHKMVS